MSEKPKRANYRLQNISDTMTLLDQACIKLVELEAQRDAEFANFANPDAFPLDNPHLDWLEHGSEMNARIQAAKQLIRFRLAELFTNLKMVDEYRVIMQQIEKYDGLKD